MAPWVAEGESEVGICGYAQIGTRVNLAFLCQAITQEWP